MPLDPLVTQAVTVATAEACEESVSLPLAKIVAKRVEGVGGGGQAEGAEEGLVDVSKRPVNRSFPGSDTRSMMIYGG